MKRTLVILVLVLSQAGCDYGEDLWPFERHVLNESLRQRLEHEKQELVQSKDIKIGTGPIAAWGRQLSADLTIRYSDGTLVYQGPVYTYV